MLELLPLSAVNSCSFKGDLGVTSPVVSGVAVDARGQRDRSYDMPDRHGDDLHVDIERQARLVERRA